MSWSTHFALVVYIFEICLFFGLVVVALILNRKKNETTLCILVSIMFVRIIVKLIYFYGEFFISNWPLNVFINIAMDTTYVLSMFWLMRLISEKFHLELPSRALLKFASCLFVLGFLLVSIFAVDRSSNHLIIINGTAAQVLYTANEVFYLLVVGATVCMVIPPALRIPDRDTRRLALFGLSMLVLYCIYVFLWNISFVFESIEPLRHIKPLDGVQLFSILLVIFLGLLYSQNLRVLFYPGDPTSSPDLDETAKLDAFVEEYHLTQREHEVLELVCQGKSNQQISNKLCISQNTTKRHLYNLYRKCKIDNRYELITSYTNYRPNIDPRQNSDL